MEHLPWGALQGASYLYPLAANVDASEKSALMEPMAQRLFARQAVGPRHPLGDLVARARLQEQIAF